MNGRQVGSRYPFRAFPAKVFLVMAFAMVVCTAVCAQLPAASFYHLKRDIDLFSSSFIGLAEDPYGFIWFGSLGGGGLYRYDGYDLRTFIAQPGRLQTTLSGSRIAGIYTVNDTLMYVGCTFGFSRLNPVTGKIENFNNSMEAFPDWRCGSTWDFALDTLHDALWIATGCGLLRQDIHSKQFTILRPEHPVKGKWMPEDFTQLVHDLRQPDWLWLGGPSGLFRYSIALDRYEHITHPDLPDKRLPVNHIYQDTSGRIWLGTMDERVIGFDSLSGKWDVFTIPVPPSSSVAGRNIFRVMPAGKTTLWVSTTTQTGLLDMTTGRYDAWSYEPDHPDGLLSNNIYRDMLHDRHGRLWIGSWYGIQYARQAFVPPSRRVQDLRVIITGVKVSPMLEEKEEPLLYHGSLDLKKEQRDITLQYVLPNPMVPAAVTYRYKLDGYDSDWIAGSQRTVRYPRLRGGRYVFMISAREGAEGEWLPETHLVINIPKRLVEYAWFWVVAGLLASGGFFVVYYYLVTRARKEERLKAAFEHQLSEIQMQALRAQMNPHFLFNSLNSIKYFAISKSKDETAAYLSKFAMLVRAILNNSKARTISLKDELDALQLYIEIEHLRLEGKFSYLFDIDNGLHIQQAQIPPMILQPIVENAIWHGLMHKEGMGRLLVQVKDMGRQIQCIIEDNGVGRARSAELRDSQMSHKKSVGMQITGDRIELINRIYGIDTRVQVIDLTDDEGRAAGTRVVIHIPLIHEEE